MKKIAVFLVSMVITMIATGQNQRMVEESTIVHPEFSGAGTFAESKSFECIDDYLKANIQYPEVSYLCKYFGTEVVRFTVTSAGDLTGFTVINSVCPKMDEEVMKVLKSTSGRWHPGTINGEPVAMEREITVTFKLDPTTDFVKMAAHCLKRGNELLYGKGNPQKALKYFDQGINLLPNNEDLLTARSLCRAGLGDREGADRDWNRLKELGYTNSSVRVEESLASSVKK